MYICGMEKAHIANFFGCSLQQLNNQYAANARQLAEMYNKAATTGKKQGGLTAPELLVHVNRYNKLASE